MPSERRTCGCKVAVVSNADAGARSGGECESVAEFVGFSKKVQN